MSNRHQPGGSKNLAQRQNSFDLVSQMSLPLSPTCSKHSTMQSQQSQQTQSSMYQLQQPQLSVMNQLKEQLEERTRILQADIKTQQQELHDIKEKLHLANLQMLLQQPIHNNEFGQAQPPQQQGPGRPAPQSQSGVIRQPSGHPKPAACGAHSSSPHSVHRENSSPSTQVQQRIARSGPAQSTNTRPQQEANQRHTDTQLSQDGQLRMLLNQPMQTLVPTSSVTSQPSQCNMGISQTLYSLDQPLIAPPFSVQQVNCNAVLVPSPVFTSPIMIPHNSFITHQSQSAYHGPPQNSQHALQLQQPQQFFQMSQGLVHGGSAPAFLHAANVPQQSTLGYIQQQPQPPAPQLPLNAPPPPPQRPFQHSQNQPGADFRNLLTR